MAPWRSQTTICRQPTECSKLGDGGARGARPANGHADVGQLLADDLQGIRERRQHHHRRAVLIVVEDGDLQLLDQLLLDVRRSGARRCLPG